MELKTKTPKEVALAIQSYFSGECMTIAQAAGMLGRTPQALYNVLRGQHRIGIKMATALHDKFGFSMTFMTQGLGELILPERKEKGLLDETKDLWGVYYENQPQFTAMESELNKIARILSQTFLSLNRELAYGMTLDMCQFLSYSDLGFKPQSDFEERLMLTICQFASMIQQVTDPKKLIEAAKRIA